MGKTALITGITGQDGSYLAEFLIAKGYSVHGIMRRSSNFSTDRIEHLYSDPHLERTPLWLHYGDLSDGTGLRRILQEVRPDEVYNLAAQSHVRVSFDQPEYTADVVALGTLRLLEAVRDHMKINKTDIRFYQAGSSEMFGSSPPPQDEETPFRARSPYAVGKVAAHGFATNYREAYGMFVSNGIMFNHESPRRGETFVTRKITRAVGRIQMGLQGKVYLGNLAARRDWGFAGDYVEAMWKMLQLKAPDDFVVATGQSRSVQDFVELSFSMRGLDWEKHVEIDSRYLRPTEVEFLEGNPARAHARLGWKHRVGFQELVSMMLDHDLELARQEATLRQAGHNVALRGLRDE